MPKTKTFMSGNSEAVRLPKDVAYGVGVELDISRNGDVVTLRPAAKMSIAEVVAALKTMPRPKKPMKRPKIIMPKRPGP